MIQHPYKIIDYQVVGIVLRIDSIILQIIFANLSEL